MVIGITINNLIRDHISQLKKAYEILTEQECIEPVNPFDLESSFPSRTSTELVLDFDPNREPGTGTLEYNTINEEFNVYEFMYYEASFEVFGRAEETIDGIIRKLKQYEKKLGVKIVLINKESPRSKCATLFFLSKNNFDFDRVLFPQTEKDFWTEVDVLITDNPKILKKKPKNKYSIKVTNNFNLDIKSDFTIIGLDDLKSLRKIIKQIKINPQININPIIRDKNGKNERNIKKHR
jgi:hypothetical protein